MLNTKKVHVTVIKYIKVEKEAEKMLSGRMKHMENTQSSNTYREGGVWGRVPDNTKVSTKVQSRQGEKVKEG